MDVRPRKLLLVGAATALVAAVAIAFGLTFSGDGTEMVYAANGPQMDIAIGNCTTDGGGKVHGSGTPCQVLSDTTFQIDVDLSRLNLSDNDTDTRAGYAEIQTYVTYDDAYLEYQTASADVVWDDCFRSSIAVNDSTAGLLIVSCEVDVDLVDPHDESIYAGDVVTLDFKCSADGDITLETDDDDPDPYTHIVNDVGVAEPANSGQINPTINVKCEESSPTTPSPVGGIAELQGVAATPLETPRAEHMNLGLAVGLAVAGTLGALAMSAGIWYARTRNLR